MSPSSERSHPLAVSAEPGGPGDLLACGASVVALVDQADAGRLEPVDDHQAGCPHCRGALRDAATSRSALTLLGDPPGPVPAGLVDRVLQDVRRHRRPATLLELDVRTAGADGVPGRIRVHPQVVADVARRAAGGVRGVQVVRATAAGSGGAVQIRMGLLVDGRTPLPLLARRLRRAVRGAVQAVTDVRSVEIDLAALDLMAPQ